MSWTNRLSALAIILVSTIISFLIVEYSYRSIKYKGSIKRTMLFEVGENFQNHDDYFKYFPNKEIRSTTLYSISAPTSIDDFVIEYDYVIETSNVV